METHVNTTCERDASVQLCPRNLRQMKRTLEIKIWAQMVLGELFIWGDVEWFDFKQTVTLKDC